MPGVTWLSLEGSLQMFTLRRGRVRVKCQPWTRRAMGILCLVVTRTRLYGGGLRCHHPWGRCVLMDDDADGYWLA
jgi:hypothetical protein